MELLAREGFSILPESPYRRNRACQL